MEKLINKETLADYIAEHGLKFRYAIEHQDREELEKLIEQIPTAYDPDRVMRKLEQYSNADEAECLGTVPVIELNSAISIVERGGADGKIDCCGCV